MSTATLRSRQTYCLAALADPTVSPVRRARLEATLADANARLGVRCTCCGRPLEAPESVAVSRGPVCAHKAA